MIEYANIKKVTLVYFILICLFAVDVFSQKESKAIDSLKNELEIKKLSNAKYIDVLNNLGQEYRYVNLDSCIRYAEMALHESQTIAYKLGSGLAYKNMAVAHYYAMNLDAAEKFNTAALKEFIEIGDNDGIFGSKLNLANVKRSRGNVNEAYQAYKDLYLDKDRINTKYNSLLALINLSTLTTELEKFEEALLYTQETIKLAQEIDHQPILGGAYHNLGLIYKGQNIVENRIEYYEKAIAIFNKVNDVFHLLVASNDLAVDLIELKNYDKAETILNDLIKKTAGGGYNHEEIKAYYRLGQLHLVLKKYQLAEKNLLHAYNLGSKMDDAFIMPGILIELGKLYNKLNRFNKAKQYLELGEKRALEINYPSYLAECHLTFHNIYKERLNFKNALKHFTIYKSYQDSIFMQKREKIIGDMMVKYDTEAKQQENEILQKDVALKELSVKRQTTARNFFIIMLLLTTALAIVLYRRYVLKRKTAEVLEAKNTIIDKQKIELEKSNANKQRLFGIVAHDLVNPFNAILGYTKLLEEDYERFSEHERKEFIKTINTFSNNNYILTRTLLDWAKVQQDKLVVNKTRLNCYDIVEESLKPYAVLADKKNIQIQTNISKNIFVEADKNMMQTVIGNLFVNAIKFTPENGEIKFHLHKNEDGSVIIEIEDNGIGMTQKQLNNLFDITKVTIGEGTHKEKGNGLGLILCKEFMELQNGTLNLLSQKDKGSRAVLTI